MEDTEDPDDVAAVFSTLAEVGASTSAQLQQTLGKSQPTISRALQALGTRVLLLGAGRSSRYGVPQSLRGGLAAQQPLWWTSEQGAVQRWGTLSFLAHDELHVYASGIDVLTRGQLPWFLAPLKLQGFLGRAWAQRLGLDGDPDRWSLEQTLYAALRSQDCTGAITLGEPSGDAPLVTSIPADDPAAQYDALAADAWAQLPAGSSAGGEQSKFLTRLSSGAQVLVKFSPPRGTPFGERWHDLLHAEALALQVLAEHGVAVAPTRVVQSAARTYLESTRFDRLGAQGWGKRHAVALDAIHEQFVGGSRQNWAATCDILATQKRLSAVDTAVVRQVFNFGHLIGNSDMHFGNLSLWADQPAKARFTLAPIYDMLPMRWRPDGTNGLQDYAAFEPRRQAVVTPATPVSALQMAGAFWRRLAGANQVSPALREVAAIMVDRV
jgi:hypothetical protein